MRYARRCLQLIQNYASLIHDSLNLVMLLAGAAGTSASYSGPSGTSPDKICVVDEQGVKGVRESDSYGTKHGTVHTYVETTIRVRLVSNQ